MLPGSALFWGKPSAAQGLILNPYIVQQQLFMGRYGHYYRPQDKASKHSDLLVGKVWTSQPTNTQDQPFCFPREKEI